MTRTELLRFMRRYRLGVVTSRSEDGQPQAAVVGIAVSDSFEIIFDSVETTRKIRNLRADPRTAIVLGGVHPPEERTVQFEGTADEPRGVELERLKRIYYLVYPDGPLRLQWPGLVYVRVRPAWIRYSDFHVSPPEIVEFTPATLAARD
jgi:Pyridoxamine 5'-phosphate oxidase